MASKLTLEERLAAIEEFRQGKKVADICRRFGISRVLFYRLLNRYKRAGSRASSLAPQTPKVARFARQVVPRVEARILRAVASNPGASVASLHKQFSKELGVGRHGIQNILTRHGLSRFEARVKFAHEPTEALRKNRSGLSPRDRLLMFDLVKRGKSVSKVCKQFGISRAIFYRLARRFSQSGGQFSALEDKQRQIERWPRQVPQEVEEKIKEIVVSSPEFSSHKISEALTRSGEGYKVGNHGVHNVLARLELNTVDKRILYARGYLPAAPTQLPKVAPLYRPQMPLWRWRMLLAPFKSVPKIGLASYQGPLLLILLAFTGFYLYKMLSYIITSPTGTSVGTFFAAVSLTLGLFFFIYSLKYYISVLMVLRLAQSGAGQTTDNSQLTIDKNQQGQMSNVKGQLLKILSKLGLRLPQRQGPNPLLVNLEKVELTGPKPFVAIHVAVYNEKKVVERLIQACVSQAWTIDNLQLTIDKKEKTSQMSKVKGQMSNYELVIVDDSTDETTEMARQTLVNNGWSVQGSNKPDFEAFVFTKPDGPRVTLIHRFSRSGFKGGALQKALENTDPRADYICVFDADFVPYPDTLEQFIKTFQVLAKDQRIAAVQGYQWHVLNKSQTWVTRGVRTEYAGSYVIERSGEELYGGLKQIAGAVYAIRADILRQFGWGTSITEDFELTLRLYEAGYKVAFTPYIQAPAEAVSTIRRLIRQRMRWAEGASFNVKVMLPRIFKSANLTAAEKLEFVYLAPYYLQAAFFVVGTFSWFLSEAVLGSRLPFWTSALGWSLVFTNLLSLPLMNIIGMFLEESDERDYVGIIAFVALSYIVVPFQAYAAIKGFLEREEGPWFRTPKTGLVTDVFNRSTFSKLFGSLLGGRPAAVVQSSILRLRSGQEFKVQSYPQLAFASAYNSLQGNNFAIRPRHLRYVGNWVLGVIVAITVLMSLFAPFIPVSTSYASQPTLRTVNQTNSSTSDQSPTPEVSAQGGNDSEVDPKNPADKDEILRNASAKEITTPRAISKTTKGGKTVEFIFHHEPRVRIKLDGHQQIEFETKTVFGQRANPVKSIIYQGKEAIYEEIIPNVDLKYTLTNDLLVEEVIVKSREAAISNFQFPISNQFSNLTIEQSVRTIDVKVISADETAFGFYSENCGKNVEENCQELFRLSQPFAKDAVGETTDNLQLTIDKELNGHKLIKKLGSSAQTWLADPERVYPVSIDPSVIVSGGIVETEVQFGGLQRKLAYMSGANGGAAWYAIYNDATDVSWKRCPDSSACDAAADWSAAQDLDTTDADNVNPSITTSGNFIILFWIDTGSNAYEGRRVDVNATAYPHTLGTICTSGSQGILSTSTVITTAAISATEAVVAFADTDTEVDVFDVTTLDGTCVTTGDIQPGNIIFGSGITFNDGPVVVPVTGNIVDMIFQDGDLSYSRMDVSLDEWTRNNLTIAAVTDNVYSVTTDGTTVWILTVSGTTATNFYSCCTADFVETQIDADAGANDQDSLSDIDMFCVTAADCKIVYTDDIDTATPALVFVDCDNESCSTFQAGEIDTDIGASGDVANPAIYCVATDNCKIVHGDAVGSASPDQVFIDCTSANEECTTTSATVLNADIGAAGTLPGNSIYCPADANCKVVYWEDDTDDLFFIDCSAANCSTQDTGSPVTLDNNAVEDQREINSIFCPAVDDCKVAFWDSADSDFTFIDCSAETCASPVQTDIDTALNTPTGGGSAVSNDIDCPAAADCKIIYFQNSATDAIFVDCDAIDCGTKTSTTIDSTGGNTSSGGGYRIDCVSATDCKAIYANRNVTDIKFVDCDNATCSSGSVIDLPGPRERGAIQCLTTDNCKFAYYEGTAATNPTVQFADCDVANCFPFASATAIDIDTAAGDDAVASIYCPAANDCKVVYHDEVDFDITFVDCDDGSCAAPTLTDIDTDVGGTGGGVSIYCPAATDCKVAYFDATDGDITFADCADATCSTTNCPTNCTDIDTDAGGGTSRGRTSIYCPVATDCKVAYFDATDGDITFADCADATCSTTNCPTNCTDIDTDAGVTNSGRTSIYCPAADDCKVAYYDGTDLDVTFADCADATCSTTNCPTNCTDIDTDVGSSFELGIYCPTATDCKVAYFDATDSDITFADCNDATCSAPTITDIDTAAGANSNSSIYCPAADDCKVAYYDGTDQDITFVDCNNADCSASNITDIDTAVGFTGQSSVYCSSTTDCKVAFADSADQDVTFADCNGASCDLAKDVPWVGQTNLNSATMTYDSTNADLYSFAIREEPGASITDIDTDAATVSHASIYCPTATDCKVAYYDNTDKDITFADCNDATCSAPTITDIDTDAGFSSEGYPSVYCPAADDCKVAYLDGTDLDATFADCADATCSTTNCPTNCTDIDTDVGIPSNISIYCPAADDCKVAYHDRTDADITFADCADATCSTTDCNTGTNCTDIDTDVGTGNARNSIYCPTATDCKVTYFDSTDADTTFADCADATCSTTNCNTNTNCTDIDTDVGAFSSNSTYCPATDDCKVAYFDRTDADITFADCNDATCSAPTITDIDTDVGTTSTTSVYCPAATDCKVAYHDSTDLDITFADCNDGSCSAPTITDIDTDAGGNGGNQVSIYCPAATDCKVAYHDVTDLDITFADCNSEACSLTATEGVFEKSSDSTTISWGTELNMGFTLGDLGHVSSNLSGAGQPQMGVVVRQGANFEFAAVPERSLFLLATLPFIPKVFSRLGKRRKFK